MNFDELRQSWPSENTVDDAFLNTMLRYARASRRTLELGSGLTTMVLASLRKLPEFVVTASLEDNREWFDKIYKRNTSGNRVFYAPLKDYGGDVGLYYSVPADFRGTYDFVVCDGPASLAAGRPKARYGLFSVLGSYLRSPTTVLMDDVNREGEQWIVNKWSQLYEVEKLEDHGRHAVYLVNR